MGKRRQSVERDYVDIANEYARDVVDGKIPACRWIRSACQRQIDDLERKDWAWEFKRARANDICQFIELLPHIKGRWKSKTIALEPWQCFILTTIFGWVGADGFRRFRKALIVIPRKNAKTTIAAGVGLYLLALDHEPGAEVFSAATTRDQARISWEIAKKMAERSPRFCERFGVETLAHSIVIENEAASFKPLSSDANSLEGLNPHGGIIDELHAHKTREVFDVLDEATGSRQQPLLFIISTEGDNPTGVFAEQVAYGQQILDGRHEDESFFFALWSIDLEDDWTQPESWAKANPNMGVSVLAKDLEIRCRQAQKNAASQASFLTKRLNVRVGAADAYFNVLAWDTICKDETLRIEDFYGKECIIGIDLAETTDIAAKVYLFPRGKDCAVFGKFYLPEDQLERGNPNYDFYRGWSERDLITFTPGNVIDYAFIERDLIEDRDHFQVRHVPYDPWNATQFATRMEAAGLPMIKIANNTSMLNEPMKELGARILAGRVKHDGNPVLSWMIGNVTTKPDANENVFPRNARPENKKDGAVALIMATRLDMIVQPIRSAYEELDEIAI